jgi:hypothetical protein
MIKNEKGRSMVEMLGVLAIIGVLSVGGIAGYSKAMYRFKMNKTIDIFNRVLNDFAEFTSHRLDEGELNMFQWWGVDEEHGLADYLDSLKDICTDREYEDVLGDIGYSCPLPIGEISVDFSTYDHTEFGTMGNFNGEFMVAFTGSNKVQACVDFLSHDWVHVVPQEWFTTYNDNNGEIPMGGRVGTNSTALLNLNPNHPSYDYKPSYTLSDVARACGECKDLDSCSVFIVFYNEI